MPVVTKLFAVDAFDRLGFCAISPQLRTCLASAGLWLSGFVVGFCKAQDRTNACGDDNDDNTRTCKVYLVRVCNLALCVMQLVDGHAWRTRSERRARRVTCMRCTVLRTHAAPNLRRHPSLSR